MIPQMMGPTNYLLQICLVLAFINGVYVQRPIRFNRQSTPSEGIARVEESSDCVTPSGEKGNCIVLRKCTTLLGLLRSGQSTYLRKSICGYEGLEPNVCCPGSTPTFEPPSVPLVTEPATTPSTTTQSTSTTTELIFPESNENEIKCGFSNFSHSRVVGGKESQLGAWPWLGALAYRKKDPNAAVKYLCGGALISPKHVLTAGHCVHRRNDLLYVRLGEHEMDSDNDGASPVDAYVKEKILHPGYNPTTYQNDIAILVLQNPVPSTMAIHPICLPTNDMKSQTFARYFPFVAGWGAVEFQGPSSRTLREVQLPVVDSAKCKKAFSTFKTTIIDEKVMCAGFARGGKDACQGDSGGPLMLPRNDQFYVIGVVSYGFRCAEPGYPGVYTRVTAFMDWINSVVGN